MTEIRSPKPVTEQVTPLTPEAWGDAKYDPATLDAVVAVLTEYRRKPSLWLSERRILSNAIGRVEKLRGERV